MRIDYTTADDGTVSATGETRQRHEQHTLRYYPRSGTVFADDELIPIGTGLNRHAFVVQAETFFDVKDNEHVPACVYDPPACGARKPVKVNGYLGVGWQVVCNCGHYRSPWSRLRRDAKLAVQLHLASKFSQ